MRTILYRRSTMSPSLAMKMSVSFRRKIDLVLPFLE